MLLIRTFFTVLASVVGLLIAGVVNWSAIRFEDAQLEQTLMLTYTESLAVAKETCSREVLDVSTTALDRLEEERHDAATLVRLRDAIDHVYDSLEACGPAQLGPVNYAAAGSRSADGPGPAPGSAAILRPIPSSSAMLGLQRAARQLADPEPSADTAHAVLAAFSAEAATIDPAPAFALQQAADRFDRASVAIQKAPDGTVVITASPEGRGAVSPALAEVMASRARRENISSDAFVWTGPLSRCVAASPEQLARCEAPAPGPASSSASQGGR